MSCKTEFLTSAHWSEPCPGGLFINLAAFLKFWTNHSVALIADVVDLLSIVVHVSSEIEEPRWQGVILVMWPVPSSTCHINALWSCWSICQDSSSQVYSPPWITLFSPHVYSYMFTKTLLTPFPCSPIHSCSYLLTVVDHATQWPEAFPLSSIPVDECSCSFALSCIACYDPPNDIMSDNGHHFGLIYC